MTDIFTEIDEDIRRERYGQLWQRYRWLILATAVLIVAGTAGVVEWRQWQRQQDEALGAKFSEAAALAPTDATKAIPEFQALGAGGAEGYPLLARFQAATLKIKGTDKAGALADLAAIAADSHVDPIYRDLATVLGGLYGVDSEPEADVIARMQPLTVAPNPWRFSAEEVTALAKMKAGDQPAALKIYQNLADDLDAPQAMRARAAEILNALQHQE